MSEIELRLLGNGDLDRYRRLRLEALRAEPTAFGSSYEVEASAKADKYRDRLAALKAAGVNALNVGFVGKTLKDRVGYCDKLRNLVDAI